MRGRWATLRRARSRLIQNPLDSLPFGQQESWHKETCRVRGVIPLIPLSGNGSRERRDGVCPCFDDREDRVGTVGTDADLVTGEGHVVELARRVVAPQHDGIGIPLEVVRCVSSHRGGHLGVADDLGLHGSKGCGGRCTDGHVSHGLCVVILEDDPAIVVLAGLGNRVHSHTASLVCSTPEGVGTDDGVDHGVERSNIRKRSGKLTGRGLGDALFNKVCHFLILLPSLDWRAISG